tara:strand:+ start:15441 stop:15974 length:534 start_codon:yes stop_codon:yes gene_type:complete
MVCKKCGYSDKKEFKTFGKDLCRICSTFSPEKINDFQRYIEEKVDWKLLDTFRRYNQLPGQKQKVGMLNKAANGKIMARPPLGYTISEGNLIPDSNAVKVHSLFKTFLNRKYTLNSLAKNFSLSVNGLKKILTNRTYLGEIKFDKRTYKGNHQILISPEIFYAVQRKLKTYLRPRKK